MFLILPMKASALLFSFIEVSFNGLFKSLARAPDRFRDRSFFSGNALCHLFGIAGALRTLLSTPAGVAAVVDAVPEAL